MATNSYINSLFDVPEEVFDVPVAKTPFELMMERDAQIQQQLAAKRQQSQPPMSLAQGMSFIDRPPPTPPPIPTHGQMMARVGHGSRTRGTDKKLPLIGSSMDWLTSNPAEDNPFGMTVGDVIDGEVMSTSIGPNSIFDQSSEIDLARQMTEAQWGSQPEAQGTLESLFTGGNQAEQQRWQKQFNQNLEYVRSERAALEQQRALDQLDLTPQEQAYVDAGFADEVIKQKLKAPERTSAITNATALGLKQGTPEFNEYVRAVTMPRAPQTTINMPGAAGNVEWEKAQAKMLSENIQGYRERFSTNREKLDNLNRLERLNEELKTARGLSTNAPELQGFTNRLQSWGIDIDLTSNPGAVDEAIATTNQMVLDEMASQKGPQTDQDRAFIATTVPSLDKDPRARANMISQRKSRILLDNMMMSDLENLTTAGTLEGSMNRYNQASQKYRDIPAGQVVDGTPMTFEQFYQRGVELNLYNTPQDAVDDWMSLRNRK